MSSREPSAALVHYLVVSECDGERDYEIEHPDCPTTEWDPGIGGIPVLEYRCGVGDLWMAVGRDAVSDIETLAPGRYPVSVHVEHTPSLPTNGGEEWDAWIEVVE